MVQFNPSDQKVKKDFLLCKYGLFIHCVPAHILYADGNRPADVNDFADHFDVDGFIKSIVDMGVEYLIFTVWNFAAQPLYPSAVTEKWRPGNSSRRDLVGEIIDGLNENGIHVILYTHPRDGHDFPASEQIQTGWGAGSTSTPNPDTFDYEKWNEYTLDLYTELADRYAAKVTGFYTDGEGPKAPWDTVHTNQHLQVVNYLKIRDIMKQRNPEILFFQNFFGSVFSADYGNTECYCGYIKYDLKYKNVEKWHAAKIGTPMTAFLGGWEGGKIKREEYAPLASAEDMARYTIFNASCTESGGIAWSTGPYAEGGIWPIGVPEVMHTVGKILHGYQESVLDAVCSKSYPTMSGSTLEDVNHCFWMSSTDGEYEYLHIMKDRINEEIHWGLPEDCITLTSPTVCNGQIQITRFEKTETGYVMKLDGEADPLDTVIRFRRSGTAIPVSCKWVNDTSKRIHYFDGWSTAYLNAYSDGGRDDRALGCFERDAHISYAPDSALFFAFEGSYLEIYGILHTGYGTASVYIDGVYCGMIDQNSSTHEGGVCCFRSMNLHGGEHILQLYTLSEKPFAIDAFKIYD